MRKSISHVIAILLIVLMFSGCGKPETQAGKPTSGGSDSTGTNEKTTVTFWTHIDEGWNVSHDKIIAEFEAANPNIKIKRESFPYDDFEAKTQTSLLSKEGGADIYQIWGGWAIDFASTGAFLPVPESYMAQIIADSYEPVIGAFKYNGKYYGIPLEFNNEYGGMLVSTPKFKQLGIPYPTTWDEMINIAKANSVSNGAVFEQRGLDFVAHDSLTYTWLSMILSSGGKYMDGDKFAFATPIGEETMQKLVDYVKVDKITNLDGITNANEMEPYQKFFLGEALMVPRGPWVVPEGSADYGLTYGTDFEYVAMPFYGSQKVFAAETGWGLAVNGASKNQEAAWKFIEYWTKPERMIQHNIACGMLPASKTVAHNPELTKAMPFMAPLVNILDGGRFIGHFNTDVLKDSIDNMFVDIINNDKPVAQALKELDSKLNKS